MLLQVHLCLLRLRRLSCSIRCVDGDDGIGVDGADGDGDGDDGPGKEVWSFGLSLINPSFSIDTAMLLLVFNR